MDLPFEAAQRPLKALVVLNRHFQKDLTPHQGYGKAGKAKTGPCKRSSPGLSRGSRQPPRAVERMGVELVTVPMGKEVLKPQFERGEGEEGFDPLDDERGELGMVT